MAPCTTNEHGPGLGQDGPSLRPGEFRLFQDLMYREAGIALSERKTALVEGRLRRRLLNLHLDSFRAYHEHISRPENGRERQQCLDALTTNETFFFRHKQHWDFLLQEILPGWIQEHPESTVFRAWSAACSTGEEPYSLAIALDEGLGRKRRRWQVHASDLNSSVLARASQAFYGDYALQKITPLCLKRYFLQVGDSHQVRSELRSRVQFRTHNLMQESHGDTYDVIFLRNVLIYFDEASKQTVIGHIDRRLRPGGHLFLGASESLSNTRGYRMLRPTIYRKGAA
ncbi:MAG: CheR family methyltransferase [Planctomycetota bacterium]